MTPRVIRTESDYRAALCRIEALMTAEVSTPEGEELDLLAALVEHYESRHFPIDPPDPIEAIKFRMEQAGLTARDLVPYIGSPSKVSEVLSRKRPLSIRMIRELNKGLGIPTDVLVRAPGDGEPRRQPAIAWDRFPIEEMLRRGWLGKRSDKVSDEGIDPEKLLRPWLESVGAGVVQPAMLRQRVRSGSRMDSHALLAWLTRVIEIATDRNLPSFKPGTVTRAFFRQLVQLSYLDAGPALAGEYLAKSGIALVTLQHLPSTHLDGAAMLTASGNPVVALTLRYDRLDSFWFTLSHELAHVALHLTSAGDPTGIYVDDLETAGGREEKEADAFAARALIPEKAWAPFWKRGGFDGATVKALADELRIHPAIVAGRVRHEQGNFRILAGLVGTGEIRKHFANLAGAA